MDCVVISLGLKFIELIENEDDGGEDEAYNPPVFIRSGKHKDVKHSRVDDVGVVVPPKFRSQFAVH
jgi:hypothetical protein